MTSTAKGRRNLSEDGNILGIVAAVTWVYRHVSKLIEFKVDAFVVRKGYPSKIELKICNINPTLLKID